MAKKDIKIVPGEYNIRDGISYKIDKTQTFEDANSLKQAIIEYVSKNYPEAKTKINLKDVNKVIKESEIENGMNVLLNILVSNDNKKDKENKSKKEKTNLTIDATNSNKNINNKKAVVEIKETVVNNNKNKQKWILKKGEYFAQGYNFTVNKDISFSTRDEFKNAIEKIIKEQDSNFRATKNTSVKLLTENKNNENFESGTLSDIKIIKNNVNKKIDKTVEVLSNEISNSINNRVTSSVSKEVSKSEKELNNYINEVTKKTSKENIGISGTSINVPKIDIKNTEKEIFSEKKTLEEILEIERRIKKIRSESLEERKKYNDILFNEKSSELEKDTAYSRIKEIDKREEEKIQQLERVKTDKRSLISENELKMYEKIKESLKQQGISNEKISKTMEYIKNPSLIPNLVYTAKTGKNYSNSGNNGSNGGNNGGGFNTFIDYNGDISYGYNMGGSDGISGAVADATRRIGQMRTLMSHVQMFTSYIEDLARIEESIFDLGVVGQKSIPEIRKMRDSFLNMATTSRYSVTQLAQSAADIVRVGYDYESSMEILKSGETLATASFESNLRDSTGTLIKAMTAFQLSANSAAHAANSFHNIVNATPLDLKTFDDSLRQTAAAFGSIVTFSSKSGEELEEYKKQVLDTTAVLTGLQSMLGRTGSQAGTTLKQFATKLIAPQPEALAKFNAELRQKGVNYSGAQLSLDVKENLDYGLSQLASLYDKGITSYDTLSKMVGTRHVAQIASMLEMINSYGGIEEAKNNFLSLSNVTEDAEKAQSSWTNSLKEFQHTLDASQKIAMSFVDGPGHLMLDLLNNLAGAFVKIDDLANKLGGSALSTAWSSFLGTGMIGYGGFKVAKVVKDQINAKKEAMNLMKILNQTSKNISNMGIDANTIKLENFIQGFSQATTSVNNANASVLTFRQSISNFNKDKTLANFGKIFTTFNWQLLALSAAVAGIMYMYRKHEETMLNWQESIKDSETTLIEFQRIQNMTNPLDRMNSSILNQIDSWDSYKSSVQDAGNALRDTLSKLGDIKPIKFYVDFSPVEGSKYNLAEKNALTDIIKNDKDLSSDIRTVYNNQYEQFLKENRSDLAKQDWKKLGFSSFENFTTHEFAMQTDEIINTKESSKMLAEREKELLNINKLMNFFEKGIDKYSKKGIFRDAIESYFKTGGITPKRYIDNLSDINLLDEYNSAINELSELMGNVNLDVIEAYKANMLNREGQYYDPLGEGIDFYGNFLRFGKFDEFEKELNNFQRKINIVNRLQNSALKSVNESLNSYLDNISAITARTTYMEQEISKNIEKELGTLSNIGINSLVNNNYGLNNTKSFIAKKIYEDYQYYDKKYGGNGNIVFDEKVRDAYAKAEVNREAMEKFFNNIYDNIDSARNNKGETLKEKLKGFEIKKDKKGNIELSTMKDFTKRMLGDDVDLGKFFDDTQPIIKYMEDGKNAMNDIYTLVSDINGNTNINDNVINKTLNKYKDLNLNITFDNIKEMIEASNSLSKELGIEAKSILDYYNGNESAIKDENIKNKLKELEKDDNRINTIANFKNTINQIIEKNAIDRAGDNKDLQDIISSGFLQMFKGLITSFFSEDFYKEQIENAKKEAEKEMKHIQRENEKKSKLLKVDFAKIREKYKYALSTDDYSAYMINRIENQASLDKLKIEQNSLIEERSKIEKNGKAKKEDINKYNELTIKIDENKLAQAENYLSQIKNVMDYIRKDTEILRKNSDIEFKYKTADSNLEKVIYGDISPVYYEIREIGLKYEKLLNERNITEANYELSKRFGNDKNSQNKYLEEIANNEISLYELRIELLEKEKNLIQKNIGNTVDLLFSKMKGEKMQIDTEKAKTDLTNSITSLIIGSRADEIKKPEITLLEKQLSEFNKANEYLDELKVIVDNIFNGLKTSGLISDTKTITGEKLPEPIVNNPIVSPKIKGNLDKTYNYMKNNKFSGNVYENMASVLLYNSEDAKKVNEKTLENFGNNKINSEEIKNIISNSDKNNIEIKKLAETLRVIYTSGNYEGLNTFIYELPKNTDNRENYNDNNDMHINSSDKKIKQSLNDFNSLLKALSAVSVLWQDIKNTKFQKELENLKKEYEEQNRKAEYDIALSSTNAEKIEKQFALDVEKINQEYTIQNLEDENSIENEVTAFHQSFIEKTSEMIQYLAAMSENSNFGNMSQSKLNSIQSSVQNSNNSFFGSLWNYIGNLFFPSKSYNLNGTSVSNPFGDLTLNSNFLNSITSPYGNTSLSLSGYNGVNSSGLSSNIALGNYDLNLGEYASSIMGINMNGLSSDEKIALTSSLLSITSGISSGTVDGTINAANIASSLFTKSPVQNFLGISSTTGNLIGGSLGALTGGFSLGQNIASGNLNLANGLSSALGLGASGIALANAGIGASLGASLGFSTAAGSAIGAGSTVGSAVGVGSGMSAAGLAGGLATSGLIALPAIGLGIAASNAASRQAKYRAAQKRNEQLRKLEEEQMQKQLEALKTERRGLTEQVAQRNLNVGQNQALKEAVQNANLTATSSELFRSHQVSKRGGFFGTGRKRKVWVMDAATATVDIGDFGYNSISDIDDTYGLMENMSKKMKELNDILNSRDANAGDYDTRKDWAENKATLEATQMLYDQIKDIQESIIKSTTALNQNFFGFETIGLNKDGNKAQEGEDIFSYDIGSWEKREDVLNNFITDFMNAGQTVGETISEIFISGVTNTFVKNNTVLNEAIDNLEKAFQEIGKVYLNPDQLLEAAKFEESSGSNDKDVYESILTQLKDAGYGNEELFTQAENLMKEGNWEELIKTIETIIGTGNNKQGSVEELVNSIKELEKIQEDLNNSMREFVDDWLEGGGNLSDIVASMDNILSNVANIISENALLGDSSSALEGFQDMINNKILPKLQDSIMDSLTGTIIDIEGTTNDLKNSILSGQLNSGFVSDYIDNIGEKLDLINNPLSDIDKSIDVMGEDALQKILAYKNVVDEINEALYERMTIDEKLSYNQNRLTEEASKYKTQIISQGGVANIGELDFSSLTKELQDLLAKGEEIPEELKNAIEAANGQYSELNNIIKDLEKDMKDAEFATKEFTSAWFSGLIEGDYETIKSELSEETQGMMDEIINAFSAEDWESGATSIGSNMASSILNSFADKLINSSEIKGAASQLNDLLMNNLDFVDSNGTLNFDMLYELSQQSQKIAIEAEANRQRFEAVESMFDYTKDIRYSSLEKEIDYQTSSTRESVYNVTNNNTFQVGNLVSTTGDLTMFANALAPYLLEAFKNYGR